MTFDANSNGAAAATSVTVSHTCTGSNLILVVFVMNYNTNGVTGVTYNGVAMTKITQQARGDNNGGFMTAWYLINPATGTHNIVVSASDSDTKVVEGLSYTGAKQSSQPDAFNSTSADTAGIDVTTSVTVVAANSWIAWGATAFNLSASDTAINGVFRDGPPGTSGQLTALDSNSALAAGAHSVGWHSSSGVHETLIAVSIAPVASATPTHLLSSLGVGL